MIIVNLRFLFFRRIWSTLHSLLFLMLSLVTPAAFADSPIATEDNLNVFLVDVEQRTVIKNLLQDTDEGKTLLQQITWHPTDEEISDSAINGSYGVEASASLADVVIATPVVLNRLIKNEKMHPNVDHLSDNDIKWLGSSAWVPSVCVNTLAVSLRHLEQPDSYQAALDSDFWGSASAGNFDYSKDVGFSNFDEGSGSSECELVASGKKTVAVSYSYDAARQKARGAPISIHRDYTSNQVVPLLAKRADATEDAVNSAEQLVDILSANPKFWTNSSSVHQLK